MADGSFQRQNFRGPPQGGMNMMPGPGMQMGMGQFGMTPQQQQQRMMFPGQQQMMQQPGKGMMMRQGMMAPPMQQGMRPPGQMMQVPVSMGMQQHQMHGMQMQRQMGPGVTPQQQPPGMPQGGFQPQQQMPGQQPMGFSGPGGFGPERPPRYMAPPPYTSHMANNYTMRMQAKSQPPANKPAQQPAKSIEEVMKQRNFQSTQRRLMELGRLGQKKVDADSMIEAIMGKQEAAKPPTKQSAEEEQSMDADDSFGDFMQGPTAVTNNVDQDQETGENGGQETPKGDSPVEEMKEDKKDIMSMMLECSDLSAQSKAKTFQKPTVNQIHAKNLRRASYKQSQKAAHWKNAPDELSDLFTVEVKKPEPPPPPVPEPNAEQQGQYPPGQVQAAGQPGQNPVDASGQPVYPQSVTPTTSQPSTGYNQGTSQPPGVLPQNGQVPGPTQAPPHIHPMFCNEALIPELYRHVLEATIRNGVIDTTLVYGLLLRSHLPKEVLGHIWSLANKTMPGLLIKEELYVVLAMIAVAQENKDITSLETLKEYQQPPVPNLGQHGQRQPPPVPPVSQSSDPALSQPPSQQPANNATSMDTSNEEFAEFHQAPPTASDSFGDFVSSPAQLKPSTDQSSENKFTFPPSDVDKREEEDDFEEFKSAEPAAPPTIKGKPFGQFLKHDHHNVRLHGSKVQDLHFDFDPCKGSESSSLSSYKLDSMSHGSDSSKTSTSFTDNNDDFDDFRSADSSENSSFGSYGGYQKSIVSNSTLKEQDFLGPEDKYAAIKEIIKGVSPEPVHGKFSMFRTEDFGSDGKAIDISEAVVFNDLGQNEKKEGEKTGVAETGEKTEDWADFQDAFSGAKDTTEPTSNEASDFGSFSQVPPNLPDQLSGDDRYSAFRELGGASQNVTSGLFSSSQTEEKDATLSAEPVPAEDEDNFGDFSSFTSATITKTSDVNVVKPKPVKPSKDIFQPQPKTVGFAELSYGAMPDEPPDWDADDDDEDFADFTGVSTLHSQDWISDTDNVPQKSRFQPAFMKPKTLDMSAKKSDPSLDLDVNGPPSLTSPASDSKHDDLVHSQSLTSLDSLSSNKIQMKEDSQSVGSLDLGAPKSKDFKDPNVMAPDSHSVSSMGSVDSGEKKSNPDQQSVRSLEFKQASADVEMTGDDFGEFSSATTNGKSAVNGVVDSQWSNISNGADTWTQAPRDASELLTDGSAVLGDRYSSATHEIQDIEKHAYEWERCLESCLEMINNANNVFNSVSRSVCNEVIKSEQGSEYVAGVVEIYRVVCRITLSIKVSATTNSKLLKLLKDIDISWNNLTAFISANTTMPDDSSLDYRSCILKSDEDDAQKKACGICLLNVDGQSKSGTDGEFHKFMYGGRQYHATCANYWVNCVDSMLPSLRLPELL